MIDTAQYYLGHRNLEHVPAPHPIKCVDSPRCSAVAAQVSSQVTTLYLTGQHQLGCPTRFPTKPKLPGRMPGKSSRTSLCVVPVQLHMSDMRARTRHERTVRLSLPEKTLPRPMLEHCCKENAATPQRAAVIDTAISRSHQDLFVLFEVSEQHKIAQVPALSRHPARLHLGVR